MIAAAPVPIPDVAANDDPSALEPAAEGDAAVAPGKWGIQVGAYRRFASAQLAAQKASSQATKHLVKGRVAIHPVKASNGEIFRARIIGVTEQDAHLACARLKQVKMPCHVVPPNRS